MSGKRLNVLLSVLVILVLALSSCTAATTEAPVVEPTQGAAEPAEPTAAVEEPAAEPTATEAMEEPAPTEEAPAEAEPTETEAAGEVTGEGYWTPEMKQAIAAAIDREVLVDRVFEGRNVPAYSMVPEGYPYATEPFLDKYGQRDLDMAIELLEQAGYTEDNKWELTVWYPPEHYGTTTADVMQVIKEQLEETGRITVNLQSQNWAEYVDSFVAGESFPLFILGWFPDFVDPENWLTPFGSCTASPDQGIFYCNEELDNLLKQAASTTDDAQREELYRQVGEMWAEELPTIPLFWEPEFITDRGIDGVTIGPPFEFNYYPLSFKEGTEPASGSADTIIIGTTDEVNSLDPQDAYATHDWEILKNTNVALMAYEPGTANLVPGAAEAEPVASEDGLQYTFTLRDNLMYADGTPITSADYVRAFERLSLEGQVSGLIQSYVDSVEAPDERTLVYTLNAPYAFFPALAATPPFIPANPNDIADDTITQFPEKLDGFGPYRMVSYRAGEQMVLEANPNYFGEQPSIPNVIIRYFEDPTTLSQAVENGEVDIAWRTVGPVEAVRLQGVEGLTVTTVDAPSLRYLAINHNYKGE